MPEARGTGAAEALAIAYRCYYHPDHFAVRRCGICSRMVCSRCAVFTGSRTVCKVCYMRRVLPERAIVLVATGIQGPAPGRGLAGV
ncbi:MAG: hypothetical protein ABDH63_03890 [Candidatus Caldarchaeales archaeon]